MIRQFFNRHKAWLKKEQSIVCLSFLTGLVITLFCYIMGNSMLPLPGETQILKDFDDFKELTGQQRGNVPDSILLINVCYDKALVDYEENGMPVGKTVITDREKLLRLLTIAKEADNYRYIFLDVHFDESLETPFDSALFHTIASMDRIVIPSHKDAILKDSILLPKAANADYTTTWKVVSFSRYLFLHDDELSVPLKMYVDRKHLNGSGIKKHLGGLWYSDGGRLCQNGVTLMMPVAVYGSLIDKEGHERERNYIYLGSDLLEEDYPVEEQIDDKILVIGDFKNDIHLTYQGNQPGSAICVNAYIALMNGDHLIKWGYVLVFFLIYSIVGSFYLNGKSFSYLFKNPWLGVLMSFFSTATLFFVVATVAKWNGVVFNMWVPTTVYSLIDTYIQKRNLYKTKKYEKVINNRSSKPVG